MNKKLLALAVAGAFVSPVAMADVSVYGVVGMSVDMVNDGAATSASTNRLSSNQSRLGFKASEDLGGGLSAIVQLEGSVAPDAGTGPTFDRNSFLGLKSNDMGTVILGHHDTPYKIATRRLDVFADTAADNRSGTRVAAPTSSSASVAGAGNNGLMSAHDTRLNVLAYISPAMNGFSVAAAGAFGAESATSTSTKGSAISLAGMYEQGPIYATLAYQNVKAGSASTGDLAPTILGVTAADGEAKAYKLGGGYTMDAVTVNAVYEKTTLKATPALTEQTGNNVYVAGKFALSSTDAVKLAYTKHAATTGGAATSVKNTDGATQYAVGYDHGMSKNTTVYALYTKRTHDNGTTASTANNDPSIVSLGMKHAF